MRHQRRYAAPEIPDEAQFGIVDPPELDDILEDDHDLEDTITEAREMEEAYWH